MKNLKKLLTIIFIIGLTQVSFSQIGLKAGLNSSTTNIYDDRTSYDDDIKRLPGFNFGITTESPINDYFSLETGLNFNTKGFRVEAEEVLLGQTYHIKSQVRNYYIDIPLTGKVNFELGDLIFFGNLGPYIGYGLSGKESTELSVLGETEIKESEVEWGDSEDDMLRRFDAGVVIGAGVEFNSIQLRLNYNMGLANISSYQEFGATINNQVIGISIGYVFGR